MSARWFRDRYTDAVWEDETLTAAEKAVAETYARHAKDSSGQKTAGADRAWLTYERLMAKAGIRRRANISDAVKALVKEGWLMPLIEKPRTPTVYLLTIPREASSTSGTSKSSSASSDGGTRLVPKTASTSSAQSDSHQLASSDGGTQPLEELPKEKAPSSSVRAEAIAALRRQIDVPDDDDALAILKNIEQNAKGRIRTSLANYVASIPDVDLIAYRDQVRARAGAWGGPGDLYDVAWCGECDGPRTRRVLVDECRLACPACNPYRTRGPT